MHCTHVALSHRWQPQDREWVSIYVDFQIVLFTLFSGEIKYKESVWIYIVHFSSVTQSCPTLCNPMNCSIPGLPVHHQHLEFTQTHGPLSHWCHPAFSSSVIPFSSCPQSLPASGRLKLLIVLELKFYDDKYLWTLGLFHGQTLPFLFPQILTNYFPISLFLCLLIFLFFFFFHL